MIYESDDKNTNTWGIVILLIGEFFGALGYILEEKFIREYDKLDPFYMVGVEGLWCFSMWIVILPRV